MTDDKPLRYDEVDRGLDQSDFVRGRMYEHAIGRGAVPPEGGWLSTPDGRRKSALKPEGQRTRAKKEKRFASPTEALSALRAAMDAKPMDETPPRCPTCHDTGWQELLDKSLKRCFRGCQVPSRQADRVERYIGPSEF